jgi:intracellular multiplication protein IcmV
MAKQKRRIFLPSFRRGIALDEAKIHTNALKTIIKSVFYPDNEAARKESFHQAAERLGLDEAKIVAQQKRFLLFSLFYFALAVALIIYDIILFANADLIAAFSVLGLFLVVTAYGARENFWYMQVKERKLGCSLSEWVLFIFGRRAK